MKSTNELQIQVERKAEIVTMSWKHFDKKYAFSLIPRTYFYFNPEGGF